MRQMMVQRVAEAIEKSYEGRHWDLEIMATAAIEAMREPTAPMLEEGPPEPYMDSEVWGRMIDAALRGK